MNDKASKLVEAARERAKLAKEEDEKNPATEAGTEPGTNLSKEEAKVAKQGAEEIAAVKVQARAGTMTGDIDVEAMGDVKGDGRDAKDYDNDDPDKALGVPVYEHGLGATNIHDTTPEERVGRESRMTSRTEEEMRRGAELLEARNGSRRKTRTASSRTVVTDADSDPDGKNGKAQAEARAKKDAESKKASAKS